MTSFSTSGETRVALVTGGAIRIGREICQTLAQAGFKVWIHYHTSKKPAQELAEELGEQCLGTIQTDLGKAQQRRMLCQQVVNPQGPASGRLDVLINNAASFEHGAFCQRTDADLQRVLETNLISPLSLIRELCATLRQFQGSIINLLDLAAYQPWPGYLDHCAAKAALLMVTRGLAVELAPDIRCNGIAPGTVLWPDPEKHPRFHEMSELRKKIIQKIPLTRIGSPRDIAQTVLFLLQSPFITGEVIAVDGGRLAASGQL